MEGNLPHHAAKATLRQQQQQRHAHQQQQLNLQLQHQMDKLQHQISNIHLEFDANNRNVGVGGNLTAPLGAHKNMKLQQQQQQQQHNHQQQLAASPTLISSSSSSSMASASTMGVRPCTRRHILPRYPDSDPDAIEICTDEPEKLINRKVSQCRQPDHQQFYHQTQEQHHQMQHMGNMTLEGTDNLHSWGTAPTLHSTHDYSYAYYEPGVPMRHSNIPTSSLVLTPSLSPGTPPQTPPPNSIRALLSKGKKNKLLVSAATRQSYQSRYKMRTNAEGSLAPIVQHNTLPSHNALMLHENFYEEISSTETIEGSPHSQIRPSATYHSAGSLNQSLVEEELRRVQTRHRKILGELNLSVEVMLMPKSPPLAVTCSPNQEEDESKSEETPPSAPTMSVEHTLGSRIGSKRLNTAASADNICTTTVLNAGSQLKEETTLATATTSHNNNVTQSGFCAADLDSGFSGSSGASYIGSLRLQKTNAALTQLKYSRQTSQNSSENVTMCTFPYATQSCRNFHSTGAVGGSIMGHVNAGVCVNKLPSATMLAADDEANDSGFFIRASCGRVLNCAKIRAAAADPGSAATAPTESIARTFWHRKGWRKLPGLSNSTSSINNTGLTTNTLKLLQPFVSSYIYLKRSTTFRKT